IEGHLGCTLSLAVSPSGQTLATTGCDGMIYVLRWNRAQDKWLPHKEYLTSTVDGSAAGLDDKHGPRYSMDTFFMMPTDDDWLMWMRYQKCCLFSTEKGRGEPYFDNWPQSTHDMMHLMRRQSLPGSDGTVAASDFALGSAYWCAM